MRRFHNPSAGVAISLAIAETISAIMAITLLRSNPFTWESVRRLGSAAIATAVMAGVIALAALIPTHGGRAVELARLMGLAVLGGAVFSLCAWRLHILTDEEQERLIGLIRTKLLRR
jgi:uncharacterized membrane protein YfcA